MLRHFKLLIVFMSMVCLMSCGFHLRGQTPLAPVLKRLYLKSPDPYGALAKSLREYLDASGVELTSDPLDANAILEIVNEHEAQQLLSVSGTQETRQYDLKLVVTFQVINPAGIVLVPQQKVQETRPLTIQVNQILGGSNELANLYQVMRQAIAFDIMNRLSSQEITYSLTKTTTIKK